MIVVYGGSGYHWFVQGRQFARDAWCSAWIWGLGRAVTACRRTRGAYEAYVDFVGVGAAKYGGYTYGGAPGIISAPLWKPGGNYTHVNARVGSTVLKNGWFIIDLWVIGSNITRETIVAMIYDKSVYNNHVSWCKGDYVTWLNRTWHKCVVDIDYPALFLVPTEPVNELEFDFASIPDPDFARSYTHVWIVTEGFLAGFRVHGWIRARWF